jgi:hypothetical protein
MPELPSDFDPALLLTMAGGTIAAGIVASVVEALKKLPGIGPWIDAKREPGVATLASFVVIFSAYFITDTTPDAIGIFGAFVAALGVAAIAGKTHDVAATVTSG